MLKTASPVSRISRDCWSLDACRLDDVTWAWPDATATAAAVRLILPTRSRSASTV
jgi:hypothetical protein